MQYFRLKRSTSIAVSSTLLPLQIVSAMLLSLSYAANLFRSAIGIFGAMLNIYQNAAVLHPYPVAVWLRGLSGLLTSAGAIAGGTRLMPVTGKT